MSIELLSRAVAGFLAELDRTSDADFGKLTKCDGWDVTALLKHVVGGAVASTMALRGATREENAKFFTDYQFGSDMRAEYATAAADHVKAFQEQTDMAKIVQHPVMDMPVGQMLMFRIVDFALHAWDLGAGMGRNVTIDPDVVQFCWNSLSPMAAGLGSTGMFGQGQSGAVSDGADLQTRLLDLSGRRPQ